MKFISTFAWLCAVALAGSALFLYSSNSQKDAELAGLRAELQKAQDQRAQVEQAKTDEAATQSSEIERLHKDNAELLRLRNEVRQLRDDAQQLTKQAQTAQADAQRAQAQATQTALASAQLQQQQKLAQVENQRLLTIGQQVPPGALVTQRNTCINNLRQIDAAKQQWALQYNRPAGSPVAAVDVAAYLRSADPNLPGSIPTCPAGGVYTLNPIGISPTCSIPGHALSP